MRSTAVLLFALACGDSEGPSESLTIEFELFKRGTNVSCEEAKEVREIEVTLFAENGITPRAGWPRKATCNGTFTAEAEAGRYVLQVSGIGELHGDPNAVLYKARTDLTLPSGSLSLSLQPEVAFLDLSWTFGDLDLAPCATEVDSIAVIVSGGGGASYSGTFGCTDTPIQIEQPFALQNYSIQVMARSSERFPLFTADMQRTLDRGLNEYTAVLRPLGGQVMIDFEFVTGGASTRFCDDPAVEADEMLAVIRNLEGGATVRERFSCMEARPYAFKSARFTQGRLLELSLIAEANARFKAVQNIQMPAGDHFTGILPMVPVGTATVGVRVESSTCAGDIERFDVTVTPAALPTVMIEASIEPPDDHLALIDLPYGTYRIVVEEIVGDSVACTVEGMRAIDDRGNDWEPFVF